MMLSSSALDRVCGDRLETTAKLIAVERAPGAWAARREELAHGFGRVQNGHAIHSQGRGQVFHCDNANALAWRRCRGACDRRPRGRALPGCCSARPDPQRSTILLEPAS